MQSLNKTVLVLRDEAIFGRIIEITSTTHLGRSIGDSEPSLFHSTSSSGSAIRGAHPIHGLRHWRLMFLWALQFIVKWIHWLFERSGESSFLSALVPRRNYFLTRLVNMLFRGWNYTVTAERSGRLDSACSLFGFDLSCSHFCHFRSYSIKSLSTHYLRWNGVFSTQSRIGLLLSDYFELI